MHLTKAPSPKMHTTRARQTTKRWLQQLRLVYLGGEDLARFARHAALSSFDRDADRLTARIIYNVHALEKGLARNHDLRPGFGKTALSKLNDAMLLYQRFGFDTTAFAYVEGLRVLQRYIELHKELGHQTRDLAEVVDLTLLAPQAASASGAGTKVVSRVQKDNNRTKAFQELALERVSVREFSGDPVDTGRVANAVAVAMKTPSVCNRQGWRVHWIEDKSVMAEVLKHQRGFGYRQMPEVLLCITVSNATFISPVERNQGFVDGGLFSMSLLYGLEYEGLAAVPLNACLYSRAQKSIRRIVPIPAAEVIVMFVAVGAFPETTKVPVSTRKPLSSVIVRH